MNKADNAVIVNLLALFGSTLVMLYIEMNCIALFAVWVTILFLRTQFALGKKRGDQEDRREEPGVMRGIRLASHTLMLLVDLYVIFLFREEACFHWGNYYMWRMLELVAAIPLRIYFTYLWYRGEG